jgi:hypothetical protein
VLLFKVLSLILSGANLSGLIYLLQKKKLPKHNRKNNNHQKLSGQKQTTEAGK